MNAYAGRHWFAPRGNVAGRRACGFALITALLMLVILTLLGVSLMSGIGLQEKMSSNTREKTRAFDAAQAALLAAQNYLDSQTTPPSGSACSPAMTTPQVCNNGALANPTDETTWPGYVTYTPAGMTVDANGGKDVYASAPRYYIYDLGGAPPNPHYYRITAWATGGNAASVAVVQAVFELTGSSGGNTSAKTVMGP